MKRILIFASAAIVALASCAKTEVVYKDAPQEIAFKQITGAMTKTTTDLERINSSMGVYAFYHQAQTGDPTDYFSNKEFIEADDLDGIWKGKEAEYYWPLQGFLDFVVYSPHSSSATFADKKLTLTIPNNTPSTTQVDWVAGIQIFNNKQRPASSPYDIDVTLQHVLSKITVQVKGSKEDVFNVSNVQLTSTKQTGTIQVDYSSSTTVTVNNQNTSYDHTFDVPSGLLTTSFRPCGSLLVLPETADHNIVVNYTMPRTSTASLSATIALTSAVWKPGYHYTYNLTLTANEILLDPVVEEWKTGAVTEASGNPSIEAQTEA